MKDSRKTKSNPAGVIQGITRGLKTIFKEREYSPGASGGSVSGRGGGNDDGCIGSVEIGEGGGGGGGSGVMEKTGGGGADNAGAVNVPLHNGQRISCPAY
jgi:hypothetical protein